MKNKKAFTLVELLAVIVILAVILVIAVPQVLDVIDTTKVGSLESSAKLIASTAEKKYAEFLALGKDTSTIQCSDVTKLNDRDYGTCTISFDEDGKATVTLKGKENGKFEGFKCEGTKNNMVCGDMLSQPAVNCTFTPSEDNTIKAKLYTVKDYDACMTFFGSDNSYDSLCNGNGIPEDAVTTSEEAFDLLISMGNVTEQELIDSNVINVEEIDSYEYVYGQYTYRYGQEYGINSWYTTGNDGWGVILTDKESTDPVTSEVCTYINDIPIISMSGMFLNSKAQSIDLTSFNTSNVTDMSGMFAESAATSLDLSSFDTGNVTDMMGMFLGSAVTSIDLSSFDTGNVTDMMGMFGGSAATSLDLRNFDTSNVKYMNNMFRESAATSIDLSSFDTRKVTNMSWMFAYSNATNLDLSSFDTSNVTTISQMFSNSLATTGYARTQADADRFNSSEGKPSTLTFVVK